MVLLILLPHLIFWTLNLSAQDPITEKNIAFIQYPGFADQHSTWNDIGYSASHDKVFVGVTNHRDQIALYEYDVPTEKMTNKGFIAELANLRNFQWQGKIHSKIIEGPKGIIYFSTDGGESREEYLMNNPHGYAGGYFMSWDPAKNELKNLGVGLQYESIKDIDIDLASGLLYGITYPQAHFLVYDPVKNHLRDLGRLASAHVPRVLFTDQWGNCYYVDWRQRLVKYEVHSDELIFARESLPAFPGTPGGHIVTGITAYAKDLDKGMIYLITYGAKIIAFQPEETGIGSWKDLGGVFDLEDTDLWKPYVPNLNIGSNGKLYYIIGGHGNFVKKDKTVMIECDPETGIKKILYEFPSRKS
ncbi:MAG: hypothetical protein IPL46_02195 [Saprospiraceae bacterium]|nr:hypothetical protein [Saprospiraceae bacterium]